jgi:RimJ/RimL family protein N-acetyltransferase
LTSALDNRQGDVIVRQLGPDDRDAYFALRLQGLKAHPEAFATSYDEALLRGPSLHDAMLDGTRATDGDFLLGAFASSQGPLVGVVGLFRGRRTKERHKASIGGMYVAAEASGQGVGRALLTELLARAAHIDGLRQIQLVVASTNDAARRLYESLGFRLYGREIEAMYVDGVSHDADLMARFL